MYAKVVRHDFYDNKELIDVVEKMSILQATCVVTCSAEAFEAYTDAYRKLVATLRETGVCQKGSVILASTYKGVAQIVELDMLDDEATAWVSEIPTLEECAEATGKEIDSLVGENLLLEDIQTFSHERIYDYYDYYKERIPEMGGGTIK